jgi:hypothetical protein
MELQCGLLRPVLTDCDQVGVRLEDCFYIDKDGNSVFLTQGVGGQAHGPLRP